MTSYTSSEWVLKLFLRHVTGSLARELSCIVKKNGSKNLERLLAIRIYGCVLYCIFLVDISELPVVLCIAYQFCADFIATFMCTMSTSLLMKCASLCRG